MRQILITVAGRNSAGKSLIAKKVAEALGLNVVKSYATRKPRPEELEKGLENCDHIFVSDEEYDKLENITAETEINGARYCTTQEILDNSAADISSYSSISMPMQTREQQDLSPAERLRPSLKPENRVRMSSSAIMKIIMDGISSFTTTGILTLQ